MELTSAALISGSLAALCFGMSKTGVPGFGLLGVTLMTLAFPGQEKLATGAVLPLLVVADLLAVGYYIRDCDWSKIKLLVLPVAIGLGIGAAVLDCLDDRLFRIVLGSIVLAMIVLDQARNLLGWNGCPGSKRFAWAAGILGGTATVIGNAAGPVMTVYIASLGFNKDRFMGTFAVFFFLVNISKLPIVATLGMITPKTLLFDLYLLPAILVGSLIGRRVFLLIPERWFVPLILLLNTAAAVKMLFG